MSDIQSIICEAIINFKVSSRDQLIQHLQNTANILGSFSYQFEDELLKDLHPNMAIKKLQDFVESLENIDENGKSVM